MKFIIPFIVLTLFGCSNVDNPVEDAKPKVENEIEQSVEKSFKIIYTDEIGWGYQIYDGSKMMINQIHIPAIQGMKGFDSKEKAEKAATYILEKINEGVFPPTVTAEILDSLGVL